MADNQSGYQYLVPAMPKTWKADPDKKRFYSNLMDLFDRLFTMKFGSTRLKKNCIEAEHISLSATGKIRQTVEDEVGGRIAQLELDSDSFEASIESLTEDGNTVKTYLHFDEDGLEIGKSDDVYFTKNTNRGYYIYKRDGDSALTVITIAEDETVVPKFRAKDRMQLGADTGKRLEWYPTDGGWALRVTEVA
jgi:hypothetical protein